MNDELIMVEDHDKPVSVVRGTVAIAVGYLASYFIVRLLQGRPLDPARLAHAREWCAERYSRASRAAAASVLDVARLLLGDVADALDGDVEPTEPN
jgi:hypothetical protein